MKYPALPPSFEESKTSEEEVAIAQAMLELAVLVSAKAMDTRSLERHLVQAKAYYLDYKRPSDDKPLVLGLGLLHLLTENRLAEFHADLELISIEERKHPLVEFCVTLEDWLMEGSYNRILSKCKDVPTPYYAGFMSKLRGTVRDEIADCSASSYDTLTLDAAQKMMVFSTRTELLSYIETNQPEWHVEAGTILFNAAQKSRLAVPAMSLIANSLHYATELEKIV